MLFPTNKVIIDVLTGEPAKKPGAQKPMTFGSSVAEALLMDTKATDGASKVKRYELALRVNGGGDKGAKITIEEATLIKEVVASAWGPMIVGQIWTYLDDEWDDDTKGAKPNGSASKPKHAGTEAAA
jgi:hypothetical protein